MENDYEIYDDSVDELYEKVVPESMRKEIELNNQLKRVQQRAYNRDYKLLSKDRFIVKYKETIRELKNKIKLLEKKNKRLELKYKEDIGLLEKKNQELSFSLKELL